MGVSQRMLPIQVFGQEGGRGPCRPLVAVGPDGVPVRREDVPRTPRLSLPFPLFSFPPFLALPSCLFLYPWLTKLPRWAPSLSWCWR